MTYDVYVPLIAAALFGATSPWLARRMQPAWATWFLTLGSATVSAASLCSLFLLATMWVGRFAVIARFGDWSAHLLARVSPVSQVVATLAASAFVIACLRGGGAVARRVSGLISARAACRKLPAAAGPLVVLDDESITAYAVPGRHSRVVLSAGALARLSASERTAVVAHERAHLRHRHHLHRSVVAVAAALNPMLARVPAALGFAAECWADEDAAARVGARDVVAAAIDHLSTPASLLNSSRRRIDALRQPSHARMPVRFVFVIVALVAVGYSTVEAAADDDRLFNRADPPRVTAAAHHHRAVHVIARQTSTREAGSSQR